MKIPGQKVNRIVLSSIESNKQYTNPGQMWSMNPNKNHIAACLMNESELYSLEQKSSANESNLMIYTISIGCFKYAKRLNKFKLLNGLLFRFFKSLQIQNRTAKENAKFGLDSNKCGIAYCKHNEKKQNKNLTKPRSIYRNWINIVLCMNFFVEKKSLLWEFYVSICHAIRFH